MDGWQKIVVGNVLMEPASYMEANHLKVKDFAKPLQPIWKTVQTMYNAGLLSSVAVLEVMRDSGEIESLGEEEGARGEDYLLGLMGFADPTTFNKAVETVMDNGIKRELQEWLPHVIASTRTAKPARTIIDDLIDWLINARRTTSAEGTFIGQMMPGFHSKMLAIKNGEKVGNWKPRMKQIGDIVQYASPTDFIIVAGYGGGGKSSILRIDAIDTCMDGEYVLTFNGENDPEWFIRYTLAYLSTKDGGMKFDTELLKRPDTMDEKAWERYMELREKLQSLPWIIQPIGTPKDMEFTARQLHLKHGLSLVQVDQIQNMSLTDFESIEGATYALRNMATNLAIPVQAAHQLRKKGKDNYGKVEKFKEPGMDDLLYAGEHAGKQIWMLYRVNMGDQAHLFPENKDKWGQLMGEDDWGAYVVRIKVAKNSSGKTGRTPEMVWYRGRNQFASLPPAWRSNPIYSAPKAEPKAPVGAVVMSKAAKALNYKKHEGN